MAYVRHEDLCGAFKGKHNTQSTVGTQLYWSSFALFNYPIVKCVLLTNVKRVVIMFISVCDYDINDAPSFCLQGKLCWRSGPPPGPS